MTLDFDRMPSLVQPRFKGGQGEAETRIFQDDMGKILRLTLQPGSSIGLHTHEDSCEIMYFLSGTGVCLDDGAEVPVGPGLCHYCPRGHSHSFSRKIPGWPSPFPAGRTRPTCCMPPCTMGPGQGPIM